MYVLRQLGSTMLEGVETSIAASTDVRHQISDVNPRYIQQLAAPGKVIWGQATVAAAGTLALPLPQAYVNTNPLHIVFTCDFTAGLVIVANGITSNVTVRAGLNQLGVFTQCGAGVTAISIVVATGATAADCEFFMYELPAILTVAGWRDGSLATGTQQP